MNLILSFSVYVATFSSFSDSEREKQDPRQLRRSRGSVSSIFTNQIGLVYSEVPPLVLPQSHKPCSKKQNFNITITQYDQLKLKAPNQPTITLNSTVLNLQTVNSENW
jgi:hypothetical protein